MNLYKVVDQNGKQVFDDLLIARQVTEKTGCTKNNVAQAAANFALVNKKYRIIPEDIKLSKVLDVELLAEWDRYRKWIEDALTRVQARQQKAIEMLHKFGYDDAKLELATMQLEFEMLKQDNQAEETTDDGFLEAMNATAQNVWGDEDV